MNAGRQAELSGFAWIVRNEFTSGGRKRFAVAQHVITPDLLKHYMVLCHSKFRGRDYRSPLPSCRVSPSGYGLFSLENSVCDFSKYSKC